MASVQLRYRSKKPTARIEIRFSFKEGNKYKSYYTRSQIEISSNFWNEYKARKNFRDTDKANLKTEIDNLYNEISKFIIQAYENETTPITKQWLKDKIHLYYHPEQAQKIPTTLLPYFDYYLNLRKAEIVKGSPTHKKWIVVKSKVENFQTYYGTSFKIKDVDEEFKKKWIEWSKAENYANSTIKKTLSFIRQLCRHARKKGLETSRDLDDLTVNFKPDEIPIVYLSFDEIDKIRALKDMPEHLDNVRDWLLISCYTGQRISDFMRFDKSMIRTTRGKKFIDLIQKKTGKDVSPTLPPDAFRILKKRNGDFPRRISDQRYNEYVKEVCRRAGITQKMKGKKPTVIQLNGKMVKRGIVGIYPKCELIGSHVGRRSFASNFYGILENVEIQKITGHSTEAMLLRYIGKSSKEVTKRSYDKIASLYG